MRVVVSPLAERNLEAIGDFIAEDNPSRARSFVAELRAQCGTIARTRRVFRSRPELGRGIRSCAYENHVIFFVVSKSKLTIVRVLHGAMDIAARFKGARE